MCVCVCSRYCGTRCCIFLALADRYPVPSPQGQVDEMIHANELMEATVQQLEAELLRVTAERNEAVDALRAEAGVGSEAADVIRGLQHERSSLLAAAAAQEAVRHPV